MKPPSPESGHREAADYARSRAIRLAIPALLVVFAAWTLGWKLHHVDISGHHYVCASSWDSEVGGYPTDLNVVDEGSQSTLDDSQLYAYAVQTCLSDAKDSLTFAAFWGVPLLAWTAWWGRKWYRASEAASAALHREMAEQRAARRAEPT